VDLRVDEHIKVEDYALQVDDHNVGQVTQYATLGEVALLVALLAQTIADNFAHMHAL